MIVDQDGLVVTWECDTANFYDTTFYPLIERFEDAMIILADSGFNARAGNPQNLKVCEKGALNERMVIKTTFSMLTVINHFKDVKDRLRKYFKMRLAYTITKFNVLASWFGQFLKVQMLLS